MWLLYKNDRQQQKQQKRMQFLKGLYSGRQQQQRSHEIKYLFMERQFWNMYTIS